MTQSRNLVLLVNPPNSNLAVKKDTTVANPLEHSDWADYPCVSRVFLRLWRCERYGPPAE